MKADTRARIESGLQDAELKLTPQRFAVLEYLLQSSVHPTAEQISADLNRRFPRASRATIYNTLHALREAGLIQEVRMDGAVARYEAKLEPHHHFVCRVCGKLEDVAAEKVGAPASYKLEAGYTVEACEMVLRGVCAACGERTQG
jgi:Fur family ferric uptake transcriptional regulator/Fur family peroxide stress response transcriptional regulator